MVLDALYHKINLALHHTRVSGRGAGRIVAAPQSPLLVHVLVEQEK